MPDGVDGVWCESAAEAAFSSASCLAICQERKDDSFLALRENLARLLLAQRCPKRNVLCYRRHGIRTLFQTPKS